MGDSRTDLVSRAIGRDPTYRPQPTQGISPLRPTRDALDRRLTRLPWVAATGTTETRSRKAAAYLRGFDYGSVSKWDLDTVILAKVVCNLRNYYQQDAEQTVELIEHVLHPRVPVVWSVEAIKLAWELVDGFTPSLGLRDLMAVAKQRAAFLEEEVRHLLERTKPGGRVSIDDLYSAFIAQLPEVKVSKSEFGRRVVAVTGLTSVPSNNIRYWMGFHLPTRQGSLGLPDAA